MTSLTEDVEIVRHVASANLRKQDKRKNDFLQFLWPTAWLKTVRQDTSGSPTVSGSPMLITSITQPHADITAGDAASMATHRRAMVGGGKYFIRDADVSIKNARGRGELPRRTPSPYLSFCFSA